MPGGQQQHLAPVQRAGTWLWQRGTVAALGARSPGGSDVLAQLAPASQVARQHHHAPACHVKGLGLQSSGGQGELGTRNERQTQFEGLGMGAHHPGHRTLVGQCQGLVTQRMGAGHQFFRVRGPTLKAEVGQAHQLGIGRQNARSREAHANTPCKNQLAGG